MNALSQFHRSPFQAYYTVISRSFLLLGIASQAFLAAVPCKGGEEVRLSSLPWFITPPPRLEVCSRVTFVCLYCILPLCFAPLLAGNLYPFDVMTSSSQVCYHAESGGEEGIGCRCDVLYRLLWWGCAIACVCVCVCVPRQETEKERVQILHAQDSCLPNAGSTAGQLFSVKGTNTEYALWIFDYHFLRRNKKSRWTPPWILIWSCFMVAQLHDWNRFSAQNSLVKVNYKGYWNDGRCHDCHYIFFSHSELRCMKMINECLFINWCVCRKEGSKMALHS